MFFRESKLLLIILIKQLLLLMWQCYAAGAYYLDNSSSPFERITMSVLLNCFNPNFTECTSIILNKRMCFKSSCWSGEYMAYHAQGEATLSYRGARAPWWSRKMQARTQIYNKLHWICYVFLWCAPPLFGPCLRPWSYLAMIIMHVFII
jgi:hypothetical protein